METVQYERHELPPTFEALQWHADLLHDNSIVFVLPQRAIGAGCCIRDPGTVQHRGNVPHV